MVKVGAGLLVIGFLVQLFSGYTYTVANPDACPATWEGDPVVSTEVYDADGAVDGYWCLVQGSYTQTNQPTYQNIPVGERAGYAQWYGFAIMLVGAALVGLGLFVHRSKDSDDLSETGAEGDATPG